MFSKSPRSVKKEFSFSRAGATKAKKQPSAKAVKLEDQSDKPPYYIRGIKAGSVNELWCAQALDKIEKQTGWTWEYQVPVNGGRRRRGGNVVDFLIDTPGRKTALDPMGRYWHTGHREDREQMQDVARENNWNLIAWFTDQTPTREATYSFLRQQLHV